MHINVSEHKGAKPQSCAGNRWEI